jgi:predicted FMN-binding regulatory protein PaiB
MLRQIVPVEFDIEHVDSTFKFGQNRGAELMRGAAAGLEAGGTPGSETLALAALMRDAADA